MENFNKPLLFGLDSIYWVLIASGIILLSILLYFIFRKKTIKSKYSDANVVKFKSQINKEGIKNGKEILYDRDGKKNKVSHWENGVREGDFTVYWSNGKPYIKGSYHNGKLSGHYIVFDKTGKNIVFEKDYN